MSEVRSLVTWDAFEDQGKIEGSDWICPTGNLKALEGVHMMGGEVTDEDVLVMADGRPQHLSLTTSPEGYPAAKIIDSESGIELNDTNASYRYDGIVKCNCGQIHGSAVTAVLSDSSNSIPLQYGKVLSGVYNFHDGTQSVITPTEDRDDPDYLQRLRTGLQITPQSRDFYLYNEGAVQAIPGATAHLDIREANGQTKMEFILWLARGHDVSGQLNLELDGKGKPTQLTFWRTGLLDFLGVNPKRTGITFDDETGWGEADSEKAEVAVLESLSEVLGLGKWTGLDLKMTASGLYKAMGRHHLDPASVLVPNE